MTFRDSFVNNTYVRLPLVLTESINTNLMECFCWFANRLFLWSAKFVSHAILLETKTPRNGDNLRKSERLHAIFAYKLLGTDISALDELIRVPHIIGTRTALGGNDMSLCVLYDR